MSGLESNTKGYSIITLNANQSKKENNDSNNNDNIGRNDNGNGSGEGRNGGPIVVTHGRFSWGHDAMSSQRAKDAQSRRRQNDEEE